MRPRNDGANCLREVGRRRRGEPSGQITPDQITSPQRMKLNALDPDRLHLSSADWHLEEKKFVKKKEKKKHLNLKRETCQNLSARILSYSDVCNQNTTRPHILPSPPLPLWRSGGAKCAAVNEMAVISAAHCLPVAVPRLRYCASERNPQHH